jgi:hypothetical protein
MQLPRGTFREIKKSERMGSILEDLGRARFSGICTLSSGATTGILVFRRGKLILAKVLGKYGDAGLGELGNYLERTGDAALSTLDETQIQLALEFNQQAIVRNPGAVQPARPGTPPAVPKIPVPADASRPGNEPENVIIRPVPARTRTLHRRVPEGGRAEGAAKSRPSGTEGPTGQPSPDPGGSDDGLDSLDSLDIENVKDKLTGDCKTMLRQLDLEHLLER